MTTPARHPALYPVVFAFLLLSACGGGGGGGGGPVDTPQFGTVTGTVREAGGQLVVANATVAIGAASTTTAANGRFTLPNVPLGSGNISVTATGFDAYSQTVTVQSGTNNHDVSLSRRSIYASGVVVGFLPPTTASYRGIIFLLAGGSQDSRPYVRGDGGCWASQLPTSVCVDPAGFRQRLLAMAQAHNLALFGVRTAPTNNVAAYDELVAGMAGVAQESGHPELASAPLLMVGSSRGGCIAHGFTRVYPARVIGFITAKGDCHIGGVSPAQGVPGYLFIGEDDPISPGARTEVTQLFLDNRALGAPWAVAIEQGSGHEFPRKNDEILRWMEAILIRRMPSTLAPGAPLLVIDETTGWLANRATGAIACQSCYVGDKSIAAWLPSEATANDWQAFIGLLRIGGQ